MPKDLFYVTVSFILTLKIQVITNEIFFREAEVLFLRSVFFFAKKNWECFLFFNCSAVFLHNLCNSWTVWIFYSRFIKANNLRQPFNLLLLDFSPCVSSVVPLRALNADFLGDPGGLRTKYNILSDVRHWCQPIIILFF